MAKCGCKYCIYNKRVFLECTRGDHISSQEIAVWHTANDKSFLYKSGNENHRDYNAAVVSEELWQRIIDGVVAGFRADFDCNTQSCKRVFAKIPEVVGEIACELNPLMQRKWFDDALLNVDLMEEAKSCLFRTCQKIIEENREKIELLSL